MGVVVITGQTPPRLATKEQVKEIDSQTAVTGTATIAFNPPANSLIAGTEQVTVADAATTVPTAVASETGLSGTSVSVVVVALAAAANTISAAAQNVNVRVKGW